MPELPEVEAARRAVQEHCVGKKIKKATVADDSKVIDGVSSADFEAVLTGKTIVAAHRKGKNMWLQLDCPPFPSFQFGMAGAVYIKGVAVTKYKRSAVKDTDEWPSKYSKLFVELDDGLEFSFTDKRRFAKVRLLENPVSMPPISELGPDALLEPMTVDEFCKSLSKKKIGIKALLLDQSFMSGIGNWMADEVLYQVTEKAIEVGADSSQFPSNWIFHSREKKPGKAFVDGKKIDFINAGGRTTAYVPELQKLTGSQAVKEASKPSKSTIASNGDDIDESENEEESRNSKVVKGRKTTRAKKPSLKKKSSASVEDSDDEEDENDADDKPSKKTKVAKNPPAKNKRDEKDGEGQKRQTRARRVPAKKKQQESDDDPSDPSESDDDGEDEEDHTSRTGAKGGANSKKKVASSQDGRQKKKAK
ncbi:hypothetical protein RD792_008441 [Penstemon davidsonii]|uniref:Formamidopyrimidine-DNA glycosylase catalytic domain-containing protein n=1 Tax=Penstemon davidsonii TaxID=160366 RepID=A0ABR0D967_9LAMI|nr:hypothetical protein RD792_008441 [Penstemon davidsonii]